MDNKHEHTHEHKHNGDGTTEHHLRETAHHMLDEGKKIASKFYEDSKDKLCGLNEDVKEYSDRIVHTVKEKPVVSLLVTGGLVYLLIKLLKR